MQFRRRLVVGAENHRHIHTPSGVGLPLDDTDAQEPRRAPRCSAVPLAHEQLGDSFPTSIGIPEEDDIEPAAAKHSRGGTGEPGSARPVQHFNDVAVGFAGDREGMVGKRGGRRPVHESEKGEEEDSRADQSETTDRLFQNRTIGSGNGQPDRAR